MKNYILTVKGLTKNFGGFQALSNVTFSIKYGDFFGLIGPNGAGKSTLLKILYGIVIPDFGSIGIEGLDLKYDYKNIKCNLGIVPQDDNLDEDLSVYPPAIMRVAYFTTFVVSIQLTGWSGSVQRPATLDNIPLTFINTCVNCLFSR